MSESQLQRTLLLALDESPSSVSVIRWTFSALVNDYDKVTVCTVIEDKEQQAAVSTFPSFSSFLDHFKNEDTSQSCMGNKRFTQRSSGCSSAGQWVTWKGHL
jgi:hypothetical protein